MTIRSICRVFAVFAFFCVLVPEWGVAQVPPPPADAGLSEARTLSQRGRFAEAVAILRPLAAAQPGRKDVLFLLGFAAVEASRQLGLAPADRLAFLDEAIAALRAMLIDEPGLVRVQLELARAFFYKGEDGLSRRHFERVLAGNPPAPVVANVRRFLSRIRARRRWNLHMGFALAPDTNIGGTSNERIIYIFGLPFRRDAESLTTSGIGLSVWGGGEYQHPLGERWRLRLGMDASRREYSGGKFDQMLLSWHAGPRLLATRSTELSILGNWRHRWSANKPDYFDLGGRFTVSHRFNRRLTFNGRASWNDRRYRTRKTLDGPVRSFSLSSRWIATPTVKLDATAGYGRDRPQSVKFRSESMWVQAGVSVALPRGFTVGPSAGFRWTDYEGDWFPNTARGVSRSDETWNVRVSVHNRALTFFGFSPEVSVVHEVRKTNAQLYDYKRTGGELRVVRQF